MFRFVPIRSSLRKFTQCNRRRWFSQQSTPVSPLEGWPRVGQMWSEQQNVERLPLPPLPDTAQRYLEYLEPLISDQDMSNTRMIVDEFVAGEGASLHQELMALDNESIATEGSYISGFWASMYLELRCRQPVNTTPYLVLKSDEKRREAAARGALLLHGIARHRQAVFEGSLPVDLDGGKPMDMRQAELLYHGARVPELARDRMEYDRSSRHAVVLRRNRFFSLDILDSNNKPRSEADILADLRAITKQADTEANRAVPAVSVLTGSERDRWAVLRKQLLSSSVVNKEAISRVDSAIYILCLDHDQPSSDDQLGLALLHGADQGENVPTRSRWWDKQQLVITPDGTAASLLEHSPVDGHVTLGLFQSIHELETSTKAANSSSIGSAQEIVFEVDSDMNKSIELEEQLYKKDNACVSHSVLRIEDLGAKFAKQNGMSPDAFCQQLFQIAYFNEVGQTDSTYEAANTKRFMGGRTETIRSVTNESSFLQHVWGCDKIIKGEGKNAQEIPVTNALRLEALRNACAAHVDRAKQAKYGFGVDRHLYALMQVARAKQRRLAGYEIPRLFQDASFAKLMTSIVSTSNVSAPFFDVFGFGAVCPQGVGLAYNVQNDWMTISCTDFTGKSPGINLAIRETLDEIKEITLNPEN